MPAQLTRARSGRAETVALLEPGMAPRRVVEGGRDLTGATADRENVAGRLAGA